MKSLTVRNALRVFASALSCWLRVTIFLVVASCAASAQTSSHATDSTTPLGLSPGSPAGSYALNGFDNINLYNGNMNLTLPLLHVGGRGGAQTAMMLGLNTKHWHIETVTAGDITTYYADPNWWTTLTPGYGPGVLLGRFTGIETNNCRNPVYPYNTWKVYRYMITRFTFIAGDGTEV